MTIITSYSVNDGHTTTSWGCANDLEITPTKEVFEKAARVTFKEIFTKDVAKVSKEARLAIINNESQEYLAVVEMSAEERLAEQD